MKHETIVKYFEWKRHDEVSGKNYWRCRSQTCNDDEMQTTCLPKHLLRSHFEDGIFLELERNREFKKITPSGRRATTKEPTNIKDVYVQCEYCNEKYTNDVLSLHRGRQSYIGGIYGCPDLDAFYENGICRELKEAMEQRMELTQAEIDEAKQKAEETNKEAERRAARLKAEAKTDKEKEEANEFAKSTENNKQMAAVYIRIKNQYIDNPNIDKATENWPYTGFAKDLRMREKLHNRTLAAAEQHFFVTRDEASYDKNQETAVKVIDDIPLLLARGFEQAGIISRDIKKNLQIKNIEIPYQRPINGMNHQQLRALTAKLLVRTFLNPKERIINLRAVEPLTETPKTSKSRKPTLRNRKRQSDENEQSSSIQFPNDSAVPMPASSIAKGPFFPEIEAAKKKFKEGQKLQQMTPKKKRQFEHTIIKRFNSLA